MWRTDDFDYFLPEELIAQKPLADRDQSRLLVLERETGMLRHDRFQEILAYFRRGDVLVANNSRVIPARLYGRKKTGGRVELLLLDQRGPAEWRALVGGRRLIAGVRLELLDHGGELTGIEAEITAEYNGPLRAVKFSEPTAAWLEQLGHAPLPPYIVEPLSRPERYQTIYARPAGSAAAPTAGLHFSPEILLALRKRGVIFEQVTLHVGLDTFKPVEVDHVEDHQIHSEWASLTPEAAERINQAKLAGGRIIAVGTTAVRTLETAALRSAGVSGSLQAISARDAAGETTDFCPWRPVAAFEGATDLFIYPGYRFRVVDAMITNFHLPKSTLMMMVSAFAGKDQIMEAYRAAVEAQYRFLSLGDAMLIL